jgi:hypothetical protein
VLEPVTAVVAPVVGTSDADPAVELPVVDDVLDVVAPVAPAAPDVSAAPANVVEPGTPDVATPSVRPNVVAADAATEVVALPSSLSAPPAAVDDVDVSAVVGALPTPSRAGAVDASPSTAPAGAPGPEPVAPGPASGVTGASGGSASTRSSGGGADLALTPAASGLPHSRCPAAQSRSYSITTGPVLEPGSRPG